LIKEAIDAAQTVRRSCATAYRLIAPLLSIGGVGDSGNRQISIAILRPGAQLRTQAEAPPSLAVLAAGCRLTG